MVLRLVCWSLLAVTACILAVPSVANDSTAIMEAGGLRLVRDAPVEILEETLTVSAKLIEVDYRFRAADDLGVSSLVAFPLPAFDLAWLGYDGMDTASNDVTGAVNFLAWADGRRITPAVQVRALRNGIDVTSLLEAVGAPFRSLDMTIIQSALMALGTPARASLEAVDAARWDDETAWPLWTSQATFYWRQDFPPDREVRVGHTYRPVASRFFVVDPELRDLDRERFCIGDYEAAGIKKRLARSQQKALLGVHVRYILTTGANWRGPIQKFHLIIDKGKPDALVSLCFNGLKKIAPTRFQADLSGFTPRRDLDVLFLQPLENVE